MCGNKIKQLSFSPHLAKLAGSLLVESILLASFILSTAQNRTPNNSAGGVVRLKVKVKVGDATRSLGRKRFYLVKGSLEQNQVWLEEVNHQPLVSRACYYRSVGASERLIRWLKDNDCESVYCREVTSQDVDGPDAVPEFQHAFSVGQTEFHNSETARRWVSVNLPETIRDGYYQANRRRLTALIKDAESTSGLAVHSVMTDRNGTGYFTDLQPGTYVLSNILPTEIGDEGVSWACELQVKAGDLYSEKPFLISNRSERNVKCVGVERPLPVCEGAK